MNGRRRQITGRIFVRPQIAGGRCARRFGLDSVARVGVTWRGASPQVSRLVRYKARPTGQFGLAGRSSIERAMAMPPDQIERASQGTVMPLPDVHLMP
jgi:hypothetical protein